ncbi:MAG: CARDB domain-containing protein [Thermoplasmata archaeon]
MGAPEATVVFGCANSTLIAVNGTGSIRWAYPLSLLLHPLADSGICAGDISGNGRWMLVFDGAVFGENLADLRFDRSSLNITGSSNISEHITINITVLNTGSKSASGASFAVRDITSNRVLNSTTLPGISGGSAITASINCTMVEPGWRELMLVLDGNSEIPELNESNNNITFSRFVYTPYGVNVSCSNNVQTAAPRENLTFNVKITNTGDVEDTYNFTLTDLSSFFYYQIPPRITVRAGITTYVELLISVNASAKPGTYNLTLTVFSENASYARGSVSFTIIIRDVYGVVLSPTYKEIVFIPDQSRRVELSVLNTGNTHSNYTIFTNITSFGNSTSNGSSGGNISGVWQISIQPDTVSLAPGASSSISVNIKSPMEALEGEWISIKISVRYSQDSPPETMNISSNATLYCIIAKPDIAIVSVDMVRPDGSPLSGGFSPAVGDITTVVFTVENIKHNAFFEFNYSLTTSYSTGGGGTGDVILYEGSASLSHNYSLVLSVPVFVDGLFHNITIRVSTLSTSFVESNLSNNEVVLEFSPLPAVPSKPYLLNITVSLNGTATDALCNLIIRKSTTSISIGIWRSINFTINASGKLLFTISTEDYVEGAVALLTASKDNYTATISFYLYSSEGCAVIPFHLSRWPSYRFTATSSDFRGGTNSVINGEVIIQNSEPFDNLLEIYARDIPYGWAVQLFNDSLQGNELSNAVPATAIDSNLTRSYILFRLLPENISSLKVSIGVPSTTPAGTYYFIISFTSLYRRDYSVELYIPVIIVPTRCAVLTLEKERIETVEGSTEVFNCSITNTGNIPFETGLVLYSIPSPPEGTPAQLWCFDYILNAGIIQPMATIFGTISFTAPGGMGYLHTLTIEAMDFSAYPPLSLNMSPLRNITVAVRQGAFGFAFEVASGSGSEKVISPAATVKFPLSIHNKGSASDTFALSAAGLPAGWVGTFENTSGFPIDKNKIDVKAGQKELFVFAVVCPAQLSSVDFEPNVNITLKAEPSSNPAAYATITLKLRVAGAFDFVIDWVDSPVAASNNEIVTITAQITKRGQVTAVSVEIELKDNGQHYDSKWIDLNPGLPSSVVFTWTARSGLHYLNITIDPAGSFQQGDNSKKSVSNLISVAEGKKGSTGEDIILIAGISIILVILLTFVIFLLVKRKPLISLKSNSRKGSGTRDTADKQGEAGRAKSEAKDFSSIQNKERMKEGIRGESEEGKEGKDIYKTEIKEKLPPIMGLR